LSVFKVAPILNRKAARVIEFKKPKPVPQSAAERMAAWAAYAAKKGRSVEIPTPNVVKRREVPFMTSQSQAKKPSSSSFGKGGVKLKDLKSE